jgi:hypothetical protein
VAYSADGSTIAVADTSNQRVRLFDVAPGAVTDYARRQRQQCLRRRHRQRGLVQLPYGPGILRGRQHHRRGGLCQPPRAADRRGDGGRD